MGLRPLLRLALGVRGDTDSREPLDGDQDACARSLDGALEVFEIVVTPISAVGPESPAR